MTHKTRLIVAGCASLLAAPFAFSKVPDNAALPPPRPVIRPTDPRADEKPIAVERTDRTVDENAFFKRTTTRFVFTNPNARTMQGELEFPLPDGAIVCGYALEVNGEMIPGVVCEQEKARVAFENETRKGVDPGLVERVKGNVWRTRIFPLNPNAPRAAELTYIVENPDPLDGAVVVESEDGSLFRATLVKDAAPAPSPKDKIASFASGTIAWDASLSRLGQTSADRAALEALPETGSWQLVVFSDTLQKPVACASRAALLAAVDAVVYDGGTDLQALLEAVGPDADVLLFSDETDTLSLSSPDLESRPNLILASRPPAKRHRVTIEKLPADGAKDLAFEPKASTLLATVWAARRMDDLAFQADARKDEFLALGRRYGVAGPGLSLIVLEDLHQWLEHKIEPPASLKIHDEWVRRRAAEDDPIAQKKAQANFEASLLRYWEERIKWWNDPKPKREKPSSGLFGQTGGRPPADGGPTVQPRNRAMPVEAEDEDMVVMEAAAEPMALAMEAPAVAMSPERAFAPGEAGSGHTPTVTLKPWDPKAPYMEALKAAPKGEAYAVYLKERETRKDSPAFYLDCAGFFFGAGETETALKVISNLAEFKLENVTLWRSMGWRLREEAAKNADPRIADLLVRAFRKAKALRGEEGRSYRDLALVLAERGKRTGSIADLNEALALYHQAAFSNPARRSARRSNDMQVAIFALEELNGLLAWCAANGAAVTPPEMDSAYRRDLPVKLRIVLSWDADETDIDIHVLEPNGEEAFYRNRRTTEGGFVSEDVTSGYGPEEYLAKTAQTGVYKVLTNYFASHQTSLTGATTVQATVYTDWMTPAETSQILTLRLDKPKDKVLIGEVEM